MNRFSLPGLLLVFVVFISPAPSAGQQLSLSEPRSPMRLAEGLDFAKSDLGNAWDFNQRRDIGFEVGFEGTSVAANEGVWRAQLAQVGAYVFPLFGGYSGSLFAEGVAGDKSLPRFGAKHQIDANRFTYLSLKANHSARSTFVWYWNNDPSRSLFPDGSNRAASFDGYYYAGAQVNQGFTVYSFDMRASAFEQQYGAWQQQLYALRFDPSVSAPPGSVAEIDWIRLVDPNSAPTIAVRWQSAGLPEDTLITVWLDTEYGGYRGTPIARYHRSLAAAPSSARWYSSHPQLSADTGVHQFPSAALPPGGYYFYVTAERIVSGTRSVVARSEYSAAVSIVSRPEGYFTAPSERSGAEYSATELNDPWDMNSISDIQNALPGSVPQTLRQFSNASAVQGLFQATADVPLSGNNETDAQLQLRVPSNKPLYAPRYRYLTYRVGADESLYPSIESKVALGWVMRPIFYDGDLFQRGGSFKAHILYEGMNTYTIDLWDKASVESGMSWLDLGKLTNLRLDPLETSIPTWFFLDWVELRSENIPTNNQYVLRWVMQDSDSARLSYDLFLSSSPDGGPSTLIASRRDVSPGSHSFTLTTSGLAPGKYYPQLLIRDELSEQRVYGTVPIVVGGSQAAVRKAAKHDYDGDGISDPTVYRAGGASSFFVRLSSASLLLRQWGLPGYIPIAGDFDGDRRADIAVVAEHFGYLHWYIIHSASGGLYYRMWGLRGDVLAVADYDGDDRDEIGVFRDGLWFVLDETGAATVQAWGEVGDVPVPADYDGDGSADWAIWRPRDGTWWIISSGYPRGRSSQPYIVRQWGLPGDVALPADFDGDGKADFVVWRPWNGTWYLRLSSNDAVEVYQWGLPGDIPVVANYLNATEPSMSVWRASTGYWFHRSRPGQVSAAQWGLPGDEVATSLARVVR